MIGLMIKFYPPPFQPMLSRVECFLFVYANKITNGLEYNERLQREIRYPNMILFSNRGEAAYLVPRLR